MNPKPTIMLYDGWCSVCTDSANKFKALDADRGRLVVVDLRENQPLLDELGLDAGEVQRVLHAIGPDSTVYLAMEALRQCMSAVDRGWMIGWTRVPMIRWVADRIYLLFARHRLRLFGNRRCDDGSCRIDEP